MASEVEPPFVSTAEKQRVAPLLFASVAMTFSWEFEYANMGIGLETGLGGAQAADGPGEIAFLKKTDGSHSGGSRREA